MGTGSWPTRADGWTTGSIPVIAPEKPTWLRMSMVVAVTVSWFVVVVVATLVGSFAGIRQAALFGHLVFLAIGFGAVLAIGLYSLALLLRWVRVSRVVMLALALDPLIWVGLIGLCLTGILLNPDLGSAWTWVSLLAVLGVGINGLANRDVMIELGRLPGKAGRRAIGPELLRRAVRVSAITQAGWWITVLIGFLSMPG